MSTATALRYDRIIDQVGGLGPSHRWLIEGVPHGARVLDAGCAGGYLAAALRAERESMVDGVEYDPAAAAKAAKVCRRVTVGSLEDVGFLRSLDGEYDRILFGDVLEHLRDPELTLREISRLLAPDGRILVSLPNIAYWSVRLDLLRGRFEYQDSGLLDRTHLRFYTYRTIHELVDGAGLQVCRQEVTYRRIPTPVGHTISRVLARACPNLFGYQTLLELRRPEG